MKSLNEQVSRIKNMMGLLNESTPEEDIVYSFCRAAEGPGTTIPAMIDAIAKIKDATQFWNVNAGIKKRMRTLDFAGVINDEMEIDDLGTIKQITDMLSKIGITASYQTNNSTTTAVTGQKITQPTEFKVNTFKITAAAVVAPQIATSGWWDKYPGLIAHMNDYKGKVHYPPTANAETGAIAIEKDGGVAHDFFPDGRWYQYATVEEGLKATTKAQYEGKWRERNGVLVIDSTDGESWNGTSKKWAKRIVYTKNNGFPLKYLQMTERYPNGLIGKMQVAIGLKKGDGYFGPTTEKFVKAKFPYYTRETGVTEDMYNSVVTKAYAYTDDMDTPESLAARQANQETFK